MAIDTHNTAAASSQGPQPAAHSGGRGVVRAFFAGLARTLGRLFNRSKSESKPPPVIVHEEVTLTPEGAEVWEQVMDSNLPIGKPTHHQRRRLANRDEA